MAFPMVHLMAAERWAQTHEEYLNCPEYYLGAISPDAVHIRDHDDKSHKNEIHLNNWLRSHPDEVLAYWREHHTPFDIGYGIHVLTDGQWVPRYRKDFPGIVKPDGSVRTDIYYNDTYVVDFQLYRENGAGERLFGFVEKGKAPTDHPLLGYYEFDEWRKETAASYRGECPKNGPLTYITREYIEKFVEDCQVLFEETYRRLSYE